MQLVLDSWLNRGTVKRIADFLEVWWTQVETWVSFPMNQLDPLTCTTDALSLLAYQRGIEQFSGEPESLFRLRVSFAHINSVDAGSVAGLQRIFGRLGIGNLEINERVEGRDWDVIVIQVSDSVLSDNQQLLDLIVKQYGRTCRRYEFNLTAPAELGTSAHEFGTSWHFDKAEE